MKKLQAYGYTIHLIHGFTGWYAFIPKMRRWYGTGGYSRRRHVLQAAVNNCKEMRTDKDDEQLPCRNCEGTGEVFVKRDAQGRVDYLSGRVINNETTRCDRCKGEGIEP